MPKFSRRVLMVALSAVVLAACSKPDATTPTAAASAPAAPAPLTKIVIGLDDSFPPMGFRDDKAQLVGFDIDLAREAAKRLGAEVEFKPID